MRFVDLDGMQVQDPVINNNNPVEIEEVTITASEWRWPSWTFGIPVIGPAAQSGNNLSDGNYKMAGTYFAQALLELFTLNSARYFKIAPIKVGNNVLSIITPKIAKQMAKRGWTTELVNRTINRPFTTRSATNRATGNAATAYFQKDGSYVVRDNVTNHVIQISNKLDPKWIPDATIINPYIPK